jgi:2-dehydro-3-deoxygluconokinase
MLRNNHVKDAGAAGIACFGEILLRLSAPHSELLLQTPTLKAHIGGAETNVAVSLAQLGHPVVVASVLPDNALGAACVAELRRYGVDTRGIRTAPGRLGLYFLTVGAGLRPSEVLYDRADSAFAQAAPELLDWDAILDGVQWFHVSGVTPAVGPQAAAAALRAVQAARAKNLFVSFDSNYRAKLWERWRGDAHAILRGLVEQADLLFAEERDMALILGSDFNEVPVRDRFRVAATETLSAFPRLQRIATTVRTQRSVDDHDLAAMLMSRDGLRMTRTYSLGRIIDRIGSGDAFAAGVLHGIKTGLDDQAALDFGLAAACLKHSIAGDFNLAGPADIHGLLRDTGFAVRR